MRSRIKPRAGSASWRGAAFKSGRSFEPCMLHPPSMARGGSNEVVAGRTLKVRRNRSPRPKDKTVAFVAFLALTTFGALATASAQPADIIAVNKAFQDHYARGNYPAAQIDAQELERLVKARSGAEHPYYAVALNRLGIVVQAQGKYTEAEELFKRALAIREKALGANHSDVGQSLHNLAYLYWTQGKYSEAEGLYKRALAIREQALGANHRDVAQTLNNLALVYRDQGKYGEAEAFFKRALVIRETALRAEQPR